MNITIGCDPEFSLIDTDLKRRTSVDGLIPGTKDKPHPVPSGAIQKDGCMVEFNTDPASAAQEFSDNIAKVMAKLREIIPARYLFEYKPAVFFDDYFFEVIPESVKELGCSADFNAWHKGAINPRPVPPPDKENMRTCSGHIHIGWTKGEDITNISHVWDCCTVVKALDNVLTQYLLKWDRDTDRAHLYGKPGAFRAKPYGVEWRVPSNAWLNHPKLWPWLFEAVKAVTLAVFNGDYIPTGEKYQAANVTKIPNFPEFKDSLLDPTKIIEDRYSKKAKVIPQGVRIAASAGVVHYDLNLDIPAGDGERDYTTPSRVSNKELLFV